MLIRGLEILICQHNHRNHGAVSGTKGTLCREEQFTFPFTPQSWPGTPAASGFPILSLRSALYWLHTACGQASLLRCHLESTPSPWPTRSLEALSGRLKSYWVFHTNARLHPFLSLKFFVHLCKLQLHNHSFLKVVECNIPSSTAFSIILEQFWTISSDRNVQKADHSNLGQTQLFFSET